MLPEGRLVLPQCVDSHSEEGLLEVCLATGRRSGVSPPKPLMIQIITISDVFCPGLLHKNAIFHNKLNRSKACLSEKSASTLKSLADNGYVALPTHWVTSWRETCPVFRFPL